MIVCMAALSEGSHSERLYSSEWTVNTDTIPEIMIMTARTLRKKLQMKKGVIRWNSANSM